MSIRKLQLSRAAKADLDDIVRIINDSDGAKRADQILARIEVFIRALAEFAEIGTRIKGHSKLRTCPVPKLPKASVIFEVRADTVIIYRISYLGRNYWSDLPRFEVDDPIDLTPGKLPGR